MKKIQNSKFKILVFIFAFCILNFSLNAYAKEITLIVTGDTHAMLYPCSCPKEPDGGIARRATLVKELRKSNPNSLLLDAGAFFAGGLTDEYTLSTPLDMQRTIVNLKAIDLMRYDAVAISDDEFNFGSDFLRENIDKNKIPFVSANIKVNNVLPYIIKSAAGIKVGIIGLTTLSARSKSGAVKIEDAKAALDNAIKLVKKDGAGIIVVLGRINEGESIDLTKEVEGVDVFITSSRPNQQALIKNGQTIVLRPSWQGRRILKLALELKDNKIVNNKLEELRLSDKVKDDADILKVLPRCFADNNCKKGYVVGTCNNPAAMNAECVFSNVSKVSLTVISSKDCAVCNTDEVAAFLKKEFPGGLTVTVLNYPERQAQGIVKDFGIKTLPAYILGKEIEKEKSFDGLKGNLDFKNNMYLLKAQLGGLSYYIDRPRVKGKLDLFISLYDKLTLAVLSATAKFNPSIHFLVNEQDGKLEAASGALEVEDCARAVCVQKYYPQVYNEYLN
ncbi:MAG: hypothetical protein V1650_03965, partial [Candidatus Omnitrophota bacterium]